MTWDEVCQHDARINGVIRRARDEQGWVAVEDQTPAELLMSAEPVWEEEPDAVARSYHYPSEDQQDLELHALKMEEAMQVARHARRELVKWLLGGGLHPFKIIQRFYCLLFKFYRPLIGDFTGGMFGEILGIGRSAFSAAMKALFDKESLRKLGIVVKSAGQKSAASSAAYAENAKKHKPRQQLGGKQERDKEREAAEKQAAKVRRQEQERELARLRDLEEKRRLGLPEDDEIDWKRTKPKRDDL